MNLANIFIKIVTCFDFFFLSFERENFHFYLSRCIRFFLLGSGFFILFRKSSPLFQFSKKFYRSFIKAMLIIIHRSVSEFCSFLFTYLLFRQPPCFNYYRFISFFTSFRITFFIKVTFLDSFL